MPRPISTPTLDELIERLQDLRDEHGGDLPVVSVHDYGDYHNTPEVASLDEMDVLPLVEERGYSRSGWAVDRAAAEGEGCEACYRSAGAPHTNCCPESGECDVEGCGVGRVVGSEFCADHYEDEHPKALVLGRLPGRYR